MILICYKVYNSKMESEISSSRQTSRSNMSLLQSQKPKSTFQHQNNDIFNHSFYEEKLGEGESYQSVEVLLSDSVCETLHEGKQFVSDCIKNSGNSFAVGETSSQPFQPHVSAHSPRGHL